MNPVLKFGQNLYDYLEHLWHHKKTERFIANLLIAVFAGSLILIEIGRQGWLPQSLGNSLPKSHFYAVNIALTMLLTIEILSLIFGLAKSVADALGTQFEILSLIFLRQSFKEFIYFEEPLKWGDATNPVLYILSDALGGLLIFLLLGFYYRIQHHRAITDDAQAKNNFIASKKVLGLALLLLFVILGINDGINLMLGKTVYDFFATFYTVLVFSDVLLVLIALRYSSSYQVVFRNSAFAVCTILIRLALTAPHYIDVLLGLGSVLFAVGITYSYNLFECLDPKGEKTADHNNPNFEEIESQRHQKFTS